MGVLWLGLNSTMVRLKLDLNSLKILLLNSLNSTMVRLKRRDFYLRRAQEFKSQFHYGSIKTADKKDTAHFAVSSQFHYGSIKTEMLEYMNNENIPSQFHYGSIKTQNLLLTFAKDQYVSIPLWFD